MSDISHLVNGNKNREARVDKIGADRLNSIVERIAGVNPSKLAAKAEGGDANHRPDAPMAEAAPSPAQVIRSQSRMAPQPLGNQPDPRVHYLIDKVARLEEKLAQYEVFNGNDNDPVVVANRPGSRRENANRGPESRVFARTPDPKNTRPDPGDGKPDAPDTKNATEEIMSGNHINILGMSMTEWREMAGVRKPIIDLTESQYVESRGMGMDEATPTPPPPPTQAFINAAKLKRNYLKNVFRQAGTPHPDDAVDDALAGIRALSTMTRTGNKNESLEDIESQIWSNILYSIGTTPDQFASFVEEADANNDEDALLAILDLEDEFVESVEYYLETERRVNIHDPHYVASILNSNNPLHRDMLKFVPPHVLSAANNIHRQGEGEARVNQRNKNAANSKLPNSRNQQDALSKAAGRIKGLRGGGEQTSAMEVEGDGDESPHHNDAKLAEIARGKAGGKSERARKQDALLAAHLANNNQVPRFPPGATGDPKQRALMIRQAKARADQAAQQRRVGQEIAALHAIGAYKPKSVRDAEAEAQAAAQLEIDKMNGERAAVIAARIAARREREEREERAARIPPPPGFAGASSAPPAGGSTPNRTLSPKTQALRDQLAKLGLKPSGPQTPKTPQTPQTPLHQSMESVWYEWLESMGISAYGYNALVENADSEDDLILIEGLQALFEAEFDFRKVGGGVVTTTPVATRGTTRGGTIQGLPGTKGVQPLKSVVHARKPVVPEYFECGSDADGNPDLRDPVWNKYLKKHSKARKEAMSRSKSRINKLKKYIKKSKSGGRR